MKNSESTGGLNVFGSALIRVAPDVASINLSVSATQKKPKAAFEETRKGAKAVRKYFSSANVEEVQSSRISLAQAYEYSGGRRHRDGYTARVSFNVVLEDLDRVEEVICGAVDAGANEIVSVDFQSRQLKEQRSNARCQAVAAAQEKAAIYAEAAGVILGSILRIQDINPNHLRGSEGHVDDQMASDSSDPISAFDPGSITVGAAVTLTYALQDSSPDS